MLDVYVASSLSSGTANAGIGFAGPPLVGIGLSFALSIIMSESVASNVGIAVQITALVQITAWVSVDSSVGIAVVVSFLLSPVLFIRVSEWVAVEYGCLYGCLYGCPCRNWFG